MSFSKKAKELREFSGLSQMRLSEKLGISAAAIGFLENHDNEPKGSTVAAYAKFFGVSTDYLLGLEDDFGARVTSAGTAASTLNDYSDEERQIIEEYRKLPETSKDLFRRMAGIKTAAKK